MLLDKVDKTVQKLFKIIALHMQDNQQQFNRFIHTEIYAYTDHPTLQNKTNSKNCQSLQLKAKGLYSPTKINPETIMMESRLIGQRIDQKINLTRQNTFDVQRRYSNIRKSNYTALKKDKSKANANQISKELQQHSPMTTKNISINRVQSAKTIKRSQSANIADSLKSRTQILKTNRPKTAMSNMMKEQRWRNAQSIKTFRQQNPLVIYPFASHLKLKRIDDNPKILASIIAKKYELMDRQQLYKYVNKLMQRRSK